MKMNKKGFTLVELLAVIVILAVVMLIGITAVGPLMTRSRKSAVLSEASSLIKGAQTYFAASELDHDKKTCATMADICDAGYYTKGCTSDGSGYSGKVVFDESSNTYTVSISSGTYKVESKTNAQLNSATVDDVADAAGTETYTCS